MENNWDTDVFIWHNGSMSTENENLPKTKSKRKPKTDKLLCTFPKCGQVKVLKEHIKKLAEEDAVLKIQLADRDACIEEMEAKLRNLLGDLYAPSSERIHLATKDGVAVEDPQAESVSLIHISEPTRLGMISYAVFCLKK